MSMATRTDTQSPALHVADSHDLIRVQGARENNLKDVKYNNYHPLLIGMILERATDRPVATHLSQ